MWEAHDDDDACAAAEAAGEAAMGSHSQAASLALNVPSSFTWDGERYSVYEVTVPPSGKPLQISVRGKSVIGSSTFSVNIFISHRSAAPSFAEHSFQYVFRSKPPFRRMGKFTVSAERLLACCTEVAATEGELDPETACKKYRPLKVWVAVKCRSAAVAELTVLASQPGAARSHAPQGATPDPEDNSTEA